MGTTNVTAAKKRLAARAGKIADARKIRNLAEGLDREEYQLVMLLLDAP